MNNRKMGAAEWTTCVFALALSLSARAVEICQTETFRASCAEDEVIMMTSAMYGRMKLGRCVETDFGFIGCGEDVLPVVDGRCSGRRACEIRIPDADLDNFKPCLGDLTRYLEADYECMKVVSANKQQCQASYAIQVPGPHGFLSSAVTAATGCGTSYHPWVIEVAPTQRVNVTLFDFSAGAAPAAGGRVVPPGTCREYAVVKEDGARNVAVCSQQEKITHVYTSLTNKVEIQITNFRNPSDVFFLLRYDAIGCEPPSRPEDTWMKVDNQHVTIGCASSEQTWRLKCVDGRWRGDRGSCSGAAADASVMRDGFGGFMAALPNGYAIIIIIAIALLISVVILTVGLVLYRRRKQSNGRNAMQLREPYYYGNGSMKSAATIYSKGDPRGYPHLPKPPPPPGMRKDPATGGVMSENEYTYRLRMQQGMMGGIPPPYCPSDFDNSPSSPRHPVEHIYESPVFARRNRDVDGPQYFELDPDGVSTSKDSESMSPQHSGACMNNAGPAPMPNDPNQNYRILHAGST